MRTALIIVAGLLLWALCLGLARWTASASLHATLAFSVLWLLAASLNMWFGVYKAGYSFREELPIFLLIFALPVLTAVLVQWRWPGVHNAE